MTVLLVEDAPALGNMMQGVLDSIISVYEQAQVALPERRYIATGGVAHDCEQLTVSLIQLYLGPPGAQAEAPQRCDAPRTAVLTIQLARCLPTGGPRSSGPTPEAMSSMSMVQAEDAWLLLEAGSKAVDEAGFGVLADVTVTEPQGGYQAVVLNLVAGVP